MPKNRKIVIVILLVCAVISIATIVLPIVFVLAAFFVWKSWYVKTDKYHAKEKERLARKQAAKTEQSIRREQASKTEQALKKEQNLKRQIKKRNKIIENQRLDASMKELEIELPSSKTYYSEDSMLKYHQKFDENFDVSLGYEYFIFCTENYKCFPAPEFLQARLIEARKSISVNLDEAAEITGVSKKS